MKTYNIIGVFLALMAIGCSTSDVVSDDTGEEKLATTDYNLLLSADGMLTSQVLQADIDAIAFDPEIDQFGTRPLPQLTYRNDQVLGMYHEETDCTAKITLYDYSDGTTTEVTAFTDIASCDLTATSLAFTESKLFVSYMIEVDSKNSTFFVRAIDLNAKNDTFIDVELDFKPLQAVVANNRLFVLTIDEKISGDNGLTLIDAATNMVISEMELGLNARQLLVDYEDNVLIGYDDLHTILNSKTMKPEYTNYEMGKEPKFASSQSHYFDDDGNLYYKKAAQEFIQPHIAAIYNFEKRTLYLYAYENFLTETELQFEYEIEDTTMVSYDEENDLLLIGYKKTGSTQRGGLLRLKLAPEPKLIDNTDFDGIPYAIYVKE